MKKAFKDNFSLATKRMRRKPGKEKLVLPIIQNALNVSRKKHRSSWIRSPKQSIRHSIQNVLHKRIRKEAMPEPSETLNNVVEIIGLSQREVVKFYKVFQQISKGNSEIAKEDFFYNLEEEENVICRALFKMNVKESKTIAFDEFVRFCASWCLYSREDILKFCFDCFDEDASGFIDENEFKIMSLAVNKGSPAYPGNFDAALQMVDDNSDGVIDLAELKILDKRFPSMFFPLYRFQEKIQKMTLGERTWLEISERVERGRQRNYVVGSNCSQDQKSKSFSRGTKLPPINPEKVDALKRGNFLEY